MNRQLEQKQAAAAGRVSMTVVHAVLERKIYLKRGLQKSKRGIHSFPTKRIVVIKKRYRRFGGWGKPQLSARIERVRKRVARCPSRRRRGLKEGPEPRE